tara:strand:+ start:598 stop:789 length:192 start_codon:yes stop_codon:yes gene_type:complete
MIALRRAPARAACLSPQPHAPGAAAAAASPCGVASSDAAMSSPPPLMPPSLCRELLFSSRAFV